MSTATLRLRYRAIQNKVTVLHAIKIPWKLLYATAFMLALVMLIFYISMVNQLTHGAFSIKNYQKDIAGLTQENNTLQAGFAESSFLGESMARAQALGFEKTTNVAYVQIVQSPLAKAK